MTEHKTSMLATLSNTELCARSRGGAWAGTPAYMAPEQFRGELMDARTDEFAFCVALVETLTGTRPFEGRTIAELATAVCAGDVSEQVVSRLPTTLRDAIIRGLSAKPSDRHASMETWIALLADPSAAAPAPPRAGALPYLLGATLLGVAAFATWWIVTETTTDAPPNAVEASSPTSTDRSPLAELGGKEMVAAAARKAMSCVDRLCRVERGFLRGLALTPELLQRQARGIDVQLEQATGLKLYGVTEDSLPGQIGLRNGDTIIAVADQPLEAWSEVAADLARVETEGRTGQAFALTVLRAEALVRYTFEIVD